MNWMYPEANAIWGVGVCILPLSVDVHCRCTNCFTVVICLRLALRPPIGTGLLVSGFSVFFFFLSFGFFLRINILLCLIWSYVLASSLC